MITPFLISPKGEMLLLFQTLSLANSELTPSPLEEGWEGGQLYQKKSRLKSAGFSTG
jgi:hypothetical protein